MRTVIEFLEDRGFMIVPVEYYPVYHSDDTSGELWYGNLVCTQFYYVVNDSGLSFSFTWDDLFALATKLGYQEQCVKSKEQEKPVYTIRLDPVFIVALFTLFVSFVALFITLFIWGY